MKSSRSDVTDFFDGLSNFGRRAHQFMLKRIRARRGGSQNRRHGDDRLRNPALRALKQQGILAVTSGERSHITSPISEHRSVLA